MRHPKHFVLLTAVGLFVLAGAASATPPHPQTADVSAAFSATQTRMHTRTCTQDGNMFRVTNATWRGTSTSTETTGDGWATGTWRTRDATASPRTRAKSDARLSAVIDNGNHLDGMATGTVRRPASRLLGNWSATIVGNVLSGELPRRLPVTAGRKKLARGAFGRPSCFRRREEAAS